MAASITVPNINPTGQNGFFGMFPNPSNPETFSTGHTPPSGLDGGMPPPPTGSPGNYNFGNTQNPNPTSSMSTTWGGTPPPPQGFTGAPSTSMNPGTSGTPNAFNLTPQQSNQLTKNLSGLYDPGVGNLIMQYLQSGGGYNSEITKQAVDAQIAAMQQQIQRGLGNLDTQMGETGISPNSSAWALETGDYESQAVAQENAITAQEYFNMWNASQNREAGLLGDVSQVAAANKANQPGFMDYLGQALGLAQAGGSFLGDLGVPAFAGF